MRVPFRIKCPRCGEVTDGIYVVANQHNTYLIAHHRGGRKCYLGPLTYKYATKTNELTIRGALYTTREFEYLTNSIKIIRKKLLEEDETNGVEKTEAFKLIEAIEELTKTAKEATNTINDPETATEYQEELTKTLQQITNNIQ